MGYVFVAVAVVHVCAIGPLTKLVTLPPLTVAVEPSVRRLVAVVTNVPVVSVRILLTAIGPPSVTPAASLIVRLFNAVTLEGIVTAVVPPNTNDEEDVVLNVPDVEEIDPFTVNVFPSTFNEPLVSVSVPGIVKSLPNVTPKELFTVIPSEAPVPVNEEPVHVMVPLLMMVCAPEPFKRTPTTLPVPLEDLNVLPVPMVRLPATYKLLIIDELVLEVFATSKIALPLSVKSPLTVTLLVAAVVELLTI
jgi:hypothetical protein